MLKNKIDLNRGFTVVELLVTIGVIGILASITLIGYETVVDKATESLLTSDLNNAAGQLKVDQAENKGRYPATLEDANSGRGITGSAGTTLQYRVNNTSSPKTFCITAINSEMTLFIEQNSKPAIGACPGHVEANETLIAYYDFDLDTVGDGLYPDDWFQYGDSGNNYSGVANDWSKSDSNSYKESQSGTDMDGGIRFEMTGLQIGQDITLSAWIKTDSNLSGDHATLVLSTPDYSQQEGNNQGPDTDGWFSVTLNNIQQTNVNAYVGLGSFYGASQGTVWLDDITITSK